MLKHFIIALFIIALSKGSFAQQPATYPKVTGYFSILQLLTTFSNGNFTSNFSNVYVIAFPFGMNIIKTDSFGISFEVAPAI
jgi:hypothetical protein